MATLPNEHPLLNFGEIKFEMSATVGALMAALAKARKAFKPVVKSCENPFFKSKYADLAEVIEATKDGLSDNGIAVLQPPAFAKTNGLVTILTIVGHASGEWIKAWLEMPVSKMDAQGVGSAITYGRRYAYSAILNVASEQDDDGNAAVSGDFKKPHKHETNEEFDQRTEGQQSIAVFQIQAIDAACKRTGKTEAEVLAYLRLIGHKRIEHVLKSEFNEFIKWANGTKKTTAKPVEDSRTKAMKRLWAAAAEYSIPEGDVKKCAYEKFTVDSMTKLTEVQLEDMTSWIKEVASVATD